MRLRLEHPGVARIACDDCKRWVFNFKTGERETYQCGSEDNLVPTPRPGPPPCQLGLFECPKESPEQEHLYTLRPENERMWGAFLSSRANRLPPRDALQAHVFTILEAFMSRWERRQAAEELAVQVALLLVR